MFIFTRFLLFSHKTPADFMNYLRFLAAFFILSVCFSCKTKEVVKPDSSEYVKIPDINFEKALIKLKIDNVQDGQVLRNSVKKVDSLDIYEEEISNLQGIEAFISLKKLNCYTNKITTLDLSKNTLLQYLDCGDNKLSKLEISKNVALKKFYCYTNLLNSVDISRNTILQIFNCSDNQISSLDISKNTALKVLDCGSNLMSNIDISKNTNLQELGCYYNQLNNLNIDKNIALLYLSTS